MGESEGLKENNAIYIYIYCRNILLEIHFNPKHYC
jgi:hypothetical protein